MSSSPCCACRVLGDLGHCLALIGREVAKHVRQTYLVQRRDERLTPLMSAHRPFPDVQHAPPESPLIARSGLSSGQLFTLFS